MGINVAQRCRAALTGYGKGHKCRLRVPGGTHGQQKGAEMSPKGTGRHSRATGWDINVAQGYRAALTGYGKGHKRRPRVPDGTHGLREGAETSPKGVGRYSRATGRGINVAQRCRAALTGYEKGINVTQGYRAALTGNGKGRKRCWRVVETRCAAERYCPGRAICVD